MDGNGLRALAEVDPDVIVLTHDDEDHTGGAPAALSSLTPSLHRQIWLPADWWFVVSAWAQAAGMRPLPGTNQLPLTSGQLADMAGIDDEPLPLAGDLGDLDESSIARSHGATSKHDSAAFDDDVHFVQEWADDATVPSCAEYDFFAEWDDAQPVSADIRSRVETLRRWLDALDPNVAPTGISEEQIASSIRRAGRLGPGLPYGSEFDGDPDKVAERVIRRASHIVRIVQIAARKAEIRWFAFDGNLQSRPRYLDEGIPRAVTVVNAREIALPSLVIASAADVLLQALRLTVQNRRALVTFVWPEPCGDLTGGFLGWSDSAGAGCDPLTTMAGATPWEWVDVMSAPHHGSAAMGTRGWEVHRDIWEGRRLSGRGIYVLLSNNMHATTRCLRGISANSRGSTQFDRGTLARRGHPTPVDAGAEWRSDRWRLWGC
ncbi:hypothetical protein [Geodermatophilus dictyosporus]|uniref:hypothetical protein n=1 Tax=Geodermatophilus dictyosporus TaxID=1523247 RepID=UPI0010AA1DA7|nr:hypothetical protein [Geodermatophilus dictyosporus]